jgi:uncharacterized protein YbjT (DUF2867 family)
VDVVTGAFSFTGRYIAARLLELGRNVRTLTRRTEEESPFGRRVRACPLDFGDPSGLGEGLAGADTLYNTYWIRFPRGGLDFKGVVEHTRVLLEAASAAGVRRVVQLSVTGASAQSPYPYFRAKAAAEELLASSGLSYAIVRPTLVFGRGEVLLNNVAWLERRLPLFVVPGTGRYEVQPVAAEDVAEICVAAGLRGEDVVLDAAGPERFTFEDLLRLVRTRIRARTALVRGNPQLALGLSGLVGRLAGETLLTRDELGGLMASLLVSQAPASGTRHLDGWLARSAGSLGRRLASDRDRPWD